MTSSIVPALNAALHCSHPNAHGAAPIRVGFVLHVMQVAGAEMLVAETIRWLAGRITPTIFCLDAVGALGERLRAEGVEVVCLGRRPGRDRRVAWRLARELRARSVEVIHAHQYTPFFYAALAKLLLFPRAPRLIFTEHGRHYPDIVSRLRRVANRVLLHRSADAINACCAFSAESLHRIDGFPARRVEVIENGIDLDRYDKAPDPGELRHRLGLDPERRYIASVARFHPVKDHGMLLHAFARVAAARRDVDLLLVGDGPLRGELEALVGRLGISRRVRFLGIRSDIPEVLKAIDVFALTSVSEAASLTLLEAMASRVAVVVTAVGGNPEIVRDGVDGLLVPRGDDAAAGAALLRLCDNSALATAMGASGRARVEERYQLSSTIRAYWCLYRCESRRKRTAGGDPEAGPTGERTCLRGHTGPSLSCVGGVETAVVTNPYDAGAGYPKASARVTNPTSRPHPLAVHQEAPHDS